MEPLHQRLLRRSTLQAPLPRQAMYKNKNEYNSASSPRLMVGKKCESNASFQWNWMYATAICPLVTNAAHGVKAPSAMSDPPTSSMIPPNHVCERTFGCDV